MPSEWLPALCVCVLYYVCRGRPGPTHSGDWQFRPAAVVPAVCWHSVWKTVVPPCGSSGNGDFGTDHYVVAVLVPSAIVALSAGTGFSIYSRRQADAYAGENVPAVKFASDVYYSKITDTDTKNEH